MEDTIKLKSRGGEYNYLRKLKKADGGESTTYLLKTSSPVLRSGNMPNGNLFVDPSGGPMITVGEYLKDAKAIVKSIDFVPEIGTTITFNILLESDEELLKSITEI